VAEKKMVVPTDWGSHSDETESGDFEQEVLAVLQKACKVEACERCRIGTQRQIFPTIS